MDDGNTISPAKCSGSSMYVQKISSPLRINFASYAFAAIGTSVAVAVNLPLARGTSDIVDAQQENQTLFSFAFGLLKTICRVNNTTGTEMPTIHLGSQKAPYPTRNKITTRARLPCKTTKKVQFLCNENIFKATRNGPDRRSLPCSTETDTTTPPPTLLSFRCSTINPKSTRETPLRKKGFDIPCSHAFPPDTRRHVDGGRQKAAREQTEDKARSGTGGKRRMCAVSPPPHPPRHNLLRNHHVENHSCKTSHCPR